VNLPDVALARYVLRANGHTACERSPAYSITRETWFCRTFAGARKPSGIPLLEPRFHNVKMT